MVAASTVDRQSARTCQSVPQKIERAARAKRRERKVQCMDTRSRCVATRKQCDTRTVPAGTKFEATVSARGEPLTLTLSRRERGRYFWRLCNPRVVLVKNHAICYNKLVRKPSFLYPCRHSCVGRNPANNACRLDSRFRGNDAFGVSEQV